MCHRVSQSVMAAEVHALIRSIDHACLIRKTFEELLGSQITLHTFVDSSELFNVISKGSGTVERRFQIDVCAWRKSCRRRASERIGWVPGIKNEAYALRKNDYEEVSNVAVNDQRHVGNWRKKLGGSTTVGEECAVIRKGKRGLGRKLSFLECNNSSPCFSISEILERFWFPARGKSWWPECQIYLIWLSFPRHYFNTFSTSIYTISIRIVYTYTSLIGQNNLSVWYAGMKCVLNGVQFLKKGKSQIVDIKISFTFLTIFVL